MTQTERDRLVSLKKAKKKLITQKNASTELGITERQVRRLLRELRRRGDEAVIHGLRGLPSNRKISADTEKEAVEILSRPVYKGFGPTLASEYLASKHDIEVSRETVRNWMIGAKLWRAGKQHVEEIHEWRQRRSRVGELVQWDTSTHDWLEGRGEAIYLINMIDDATSRWFSRFVASDSTVENMNLLERYLKKYGRPLAVYTDKASLFQTAVKTRRDESRAGKDREELPPTQIGRALLDLGITWIAAHSPQAKGRVERGFLTAQDRLVKGLRVEGITTMEQANQYLESEFLPWVRNTISVEPANADDAHKPLEKHHDLAAILSEVDSRHVNNDYTIQFERKIYQIARKDIRAGLRGATVRVEQRRDGTVAVRFGERYLNITRCEQRPQVVETKPTQPKMKSPEATRPDKRREWGRNFELQDAPKIWQVANSSGTKPEDES